MSKDFESLRFDPRQCKCEADEFRKLLDESPELEERRHILPFFRTRKHLSAYLGRYNSNIVRYDLLAYEFALLVTFPATSLSATL